jgi:hypothetical protein
MHLLHLKGSDIGGLEQKLTEQMTVSTCLLNFVKDMSWFALTKIQTSNQPLRMMANMLAF